MKRIIIFSGIITLIANILVGMILSFYNTFNVVVSSIIIAKTTALLVLIDTLCLKDGLKISLFCLFAGFSILEYALSLLAPNQLENNWWLIVVIVLIAIETILLLITNTISKRLDNKTTT